MNKRKIILCALVLVAAVTILSLYSQSGPAVSLRVVKMETNNIPDLGLRSVMATVQMTNHTRRPVLYLGANYAEPSYKVSFSTDKGLVSSGSGNCFSVFDWALSAKKSTDFRVSLSDFKTPVQISVDYTQSSPLRRFYQFLPAALGRRLPWAESKHTASIVVSPDTSLLTEARAHKP